MHNNNILKASFIGVCLQFKVVWMHSMLCSMWGLGFRSGKWGLGVRSGMWGLGVRSGVWGIGARSGYLGHGKKNHSHTLDMYFQHRRPCIRICYDIVQYAIAVAIYIYNVHKPSREEWGLGQMIGRLFYICDHSRECWKWNHAEVWMVRIAQIGPLSFQAAIEHKPRQVR